MHDDELKLQPLEATDTASPKSFKSAKAEQLNRSELNRPAAPDSVKSSTATDRLSSIDVFRGAVMFLMLAEVLKLFELIKSYPDKAWAQWLNFHTTHVEWVGCSLHDMIQPGFTFLVGVSLPFSLQSRIQRGCSKWSMAWHALARSILLVALGIALRSLGRESTFYTFTDTLSQIGLGYSFVYLLAWTNWSKQLLAGITVLVGYWAWFAFSSLPSEDFDWASVGVAADWPHRMSGFAAHWNKNVNPAAYFDQWFLNLFPCEKPFKFQSGGYVTLNFIPTMVTMILGLLAGVLLKTQWSVSRRFAFLMIAGAGLLCCGWLLGYLGICPVVKRIWTPSWVLFSGGICFITLAALHVVCDAWKFRAWAFPLLVIGANSIVAYVMSWTVEEPCKHFWIRHLGKDSFASFGAACQPVVLGATVLATFWLVLYWLYRQRIFVRI